jgi:CRP/FNR family transcriptional regulator, cyclic AMP receptor protein
MASLLDTCASLPVWSYEPGDTVIQEDCKDGRLFILKSGAVEVQKWNQTLNRSASPGAVFGEVSALLNTAYSASVLAVEPSEFYVAEDGAAFLKQHPALNLHIARLLAFRLQRITVQLVALEDQLEASGKPAFAFEGVLCSLADQLIP